MQIKRLITPQSPKKCRLNITEKCESEIQYKKKLKKFDNFNLKNEIPLNCIFICGIITKNEGKKERNECFETILKREINIGDL